MSLEATAGKNPVTHVGKLYNLLALRIARRLDKELGAAYSGVKILFRIGDPVAEMWAVDVTTTIDDDHAVADVVETGFGEIEAIRADLLSGSIEVF